MRSFILAMACAAATAGTPGIRDTRRMVTVCTDAGNNSRLARTALVTASEIFAQIGVTIQWYEGNRCPWQGAIRVTLSPETPPDSMPRALAYARPYEGFHIVIFVDRVKGASQRNLAFRLPGFVLAHEIGHLLEGREEHSATGIMKASWDNRDYFAMDRNRLGFADEDVERMDRGLEWRRSPAALSNIMRDPLYSSSSIRKCRAQTAQESRPPGGGGSGLNNELTPAASDTRTPAPDRGSLPRRA